MRKPSKSRAVSSFRLIWSLDGSYICTVHAKDASAARRKAPMPYRKYLGEIAVEAGTGPRVEIEETPVKSVHSRIYRIDWYRNGNCFVSSNVNAALAGAYINGAWCHDAAMPDDVRTLAMEVRP